MIGPGFDQDAFQRDVTRLIQRYGRMRAREFSLIRFAGERAGLPQISPSEDQ